MAFTVATKQVKAVKGLTRKHKVRIQPAQSVECNGTYWDGGSRSTYCTLDLNARTTGRIDYSTSPEWFGGKPTPIVTLTPRTAVVQGGTFCGKDATLCVYVLPCDLPRLFDLPAAFQDDTPANVVLDYLAEQGIQTS